MKWNTNAFDDLCWKQNIWHSNQYTLFQFIFTIIFFDLNWCVITRFICVITNTWILKIMNGVFVTRDGRHRHCHVQNFHSWRVENVHNMTSVLLLNHLLWRMRVFYLHVILFIYLLFIWNINWKAGRICFCSQVSQI